jgi:hypothetical protein
MTALNLPRVWASDDDYLSGSANGTPTKQDIGAALSAQGVLPGRATAQGFNFILNQYSVICARSGLLAASMLRPAHVPGVTFATTGGIAAVSQGSTSLPLIGAVGGANGTFFAHPGSSLLGPGSVNLGSLTSCTGIARNASTGRVVVVGATSPFSAFSTNNGTSWSDGGNQIAAAALSLEWTAASTGFFVASRSSSVNVFRSADGVSWAAVNSGLDAGGSATYGGLAVLSSGRIINVGRLNTLDNLNLSFSDDGGATWTVSGTIPNSATIGAIGPGRLAGNGGSKIYHCGRTSATTAQISESTDGVSWTVAGTITSPTAFNADPKIMVCRDTGLMAIAATTTAGPSYLWVSGDGVTWHGPINIPTLGNLANIFLAGGRILLNNGASVAITDGVS